MKIILKDKIEFYFTIIDTYNIIDNIRVLFKYQ